MRTEPFGRDLRLRTSWKVALLGWQDALVYRFNALVWVLSATLPALPLMLVWKAAYEGDPTARIGGLNLGEMMTYYFFVTALSARFELRGSFRVATRTFSL